MRRLGFVGRQVMAAKGAPPPLVGADFTQGVLPSGWTFNRASAATDLVITDPPGRAYNTYANDQPRMTALGMLNEQSRNSWFLNSNAPATQAPNLAVRSYGFWFNGTGTVTITTGTAVCGTLPPVCNGQTAYTFDVTTAGTVNFTISGSVNAAMLEQADASGSYSPSSFIVNTATVATRAADFMVATTPTWLNAAAGTYVVEYIPLNNTSVTAQRLLVAAGTDTANNQDRFFTSGAGAAMIMATSSVASGLSTTRLDGVPFILGNVYKDGFATMDRRQIRCQNGVVRGTAISARNMVDLIALSLGYLYGGGNQLNGYIRAFRYWPYALDTESLRLQTV
ncbi:MAG TPA: hypothetical protein VGN34_01710 [Ktedonobacteraceae bacterium]|jgi:hypothetical protein